jgi:L-fuculose-phosphate aldolase
MMNPVSSAGISARDLRRALAYACRILAANGQNDTVYGHVSHREPGAATFWMKPAGIGLDQMMPERAIRVDLDGAVVEGNHPRHREWPIHAALFRARPEVTCVIHTHPIYSIAFAAIEQPLRSVSHEGAMFVPPDVPRFTLTSDLIETPELGRALAETMGTALGCYLRNHGIAVAAASIEEATVAAINLERASQVQLLALSAGVPVHGTGDAEALAKRRLYAPAALRAVWDYYCHTVGPLPRERP